MGSLTYYSANALMDLTLSGTAFASPATVYLGWFTSPPGADSTGTEVTGGAYVRKAITFDPASTGNIVSDAAITWTAFHAAADQMLCGYGIWDAATGGNLLAFGRTPSLVIPLGGPLVVPAAAITVASDDNAMSDYLADAWLDHLFTNTAYTAPTDVYLGHYTTTPTATTSGTEVSATGYTRQTSTWDPTSEGISLLAATVTWAPLTSAADQTIEGFALTDASTVGNVLWFHTWPEAIDYTAGDTIELAASTIGLQAT